MMSFDETVYRTHYAQQDAVFCHITLQLDERLEMAWQRQHTIATGKTLTPKLPCFNGTLTRLSLPIRERIVDTVAPPYSLAVVVTDEMPESFEEAAELWYRQQTKDCVEPSTPSIIVPIATGSLIADRSPAETEYPGITVDWVDDNGVRWPIALIEYDPTAGVVMRLWQPDAEDPIVNQVWRHPQIVPNPST